MNKLILTLAKESGISFGGHPMNPLNVYPSQLEKFAELIVRECLAHGKLTQSQAVVNGSEEYNAGREMGIEVFMNKIRNHFGVE
jgi:hypothetical protein